MFMSDYDIELCDKLFHFREDFEEDNIYCYQILYVLINEIVFNPKENISIDVKENLKTTIEVILNFFELINEDIDEDFNLKKVDVTNKNDLINGIIFFNKIYLSQNNFIINDFNLLSDMNDLIQKINAFSLKDENLFSSELKEENDLIFPVLEEEKKNQLKNPSYLKEYLIRKKIINYQCENCGLIEWQNEPLGLILDFRDGNKNNQNISNLRFLCPNCYSQIGRV